MLVTQKHETRLYRLLDQASDPNLHLTLRVVPALLAILAASALRGLLARTVGQPRVVGEMVAGVLLGPTLLGLLAPGVERNLFPASIKPALYLLSTMGLTLYMFLVGLGLASIVHESRQLADGGFVSVRWGLFGAGAG